MQNKKLEIIFSKHFDYILNHFDFGVLPSGLRSDDKIRVEYCEGHYSENESWDDHTIVQVLRERDLTPEEIQKNKDALTLLAEESKNKRYQNYLKLKSEFEPS